MLSLNVKAPSPLVKDPADPKMFLIVKVDPAKEQLLPTVEAGLVALVTEQEETTTGKPEGKTISITLSEGSE